jgi:hypothetical protein
MNKANRYLRMIIHMSPSNRKVKGTTRRGYPSVGDWNKVRSNQRLFLPHGERHGQPRHGLYGRRLTRLSSPSLKSHKLLWLEWTRGRLPRSPRTPAW